MKIAINGTSLIHKTKTGVELYVVQLLENIAKLEKQKQFEFYVYYPDIKDSEIDDAYLKQFPNNWHFKKVTWKWKYFWTQLAFYKELKKDNIDLLFIPAHVIPFLYKGKALMTVHDLAFKHFPETYSTKELIYQDKAIKSAIKKNADFIVPSYTTAEDLSKFYNLDKSKIHVVYHGFTGQKFLSFSDEEIERHKNKFNIKNKYFISVSRIEKKKNSDGIILAFEKFLQKYPYLKDEIDLVLVGKAGYAYDEIYNLYKKSIFKDNIKLLGYLDSEDLSALMQGASAFVFPSIYEGFGFPILEAMSFNLPLITSNYGVMKELAEEHAFLVDPKNLDELALAMYKALFNKEQVENYIKSYPQLLNKFTWEKSAEETLNLFELYV